MHYFDTSTGIVYGPNSTEKTFMAQNDCDL